MGLPTIALDNRLNDNKWRTLLKDQGLSVVFQEEEPVKRVKASWYIVKSGDTELRVLEGVPREGYTDQQASLEFMAFRNSAERSLFEFVKSILIPVE